ncbi:MAG: hypothetical protein HY720_15055 [Planctomycetes bacterium]|nr:hypothetical protein [Planctomycetota bacterium]
MRQIDVQHELVDWSLKAVELAGDVQQLYEEAHEAAAEEALKRLADADFTTIGPELWRKFGEEIASRGRDEALALLMDEVDNVIDALVEAQVEKAGLEAQGAGADEVGSLAAQNAEAGRIQTDRLLLDLFMLPLKNLILPIKETGKFRPRAGLATFEIAIAVIEIVNDGVRNYRTTRSEQALIDHLYQLIANQEHPVLDLIVKILGAIPPEIDRLSQVVQNRQVVYGRYFPAGKDPKDLDSQAPEEEQRAAGEALRRGDSSATLDQRREYGIDQVQKMLALLQEAWDLWKSLGPSTATARQDDRTRLQDALQRWIAGARTAMDERLSVTRPTVPTAVRRLAEAWEKVKERMIRLQKARNPWHDGESIHRAHTPRNYVDYIGTHDSYQGHFWSLVILSPPGGGYFKTQDGDSRFVYAGAMPEVLRRLGLAGIAANELRQGLAEIRDLFAWAKKWLEETELRWDPSSLTVEIPAPSTGEAGLYGGGDFDRVRRVVLHSPGEDAKRAEEIEASTRETRGWSVAVDGFTAEVLGLPKALPFTVTVFYQPVHMQVGDNGSPEIIVLGKEFEDHVRVVYMPETSATGSEVANIDFGPQPGLALVAPGLVSARQAGSFRLAASKKWIAVREAFREETWTEIEDGQEITRRRYWYKLEQDGLRTVPDPAGYDPTAWVWVNAMTLIELRGSAWGLAAAPGETSAVPSFGFNSSRIDILKSERVVGPHTFPVGRAPFWVWAEFGTEPGKTTGGRVEVTSRLEYSASNGTIAHVEGTNVVADSFGKCRITGRVPERYGTQATPPGQLEAGFDVNVFGFAVPEEYTVNAGETVTLAVQPKGEVPALSLVTLDWNSRNHGEFLGQAGKPPVTVVQALIAKAPTIEWRAPVLPGVYPIDLYITIPSRPDPTILSYQIRVRVTDPKSRDDELKFGIADSGRHLVLQTETPDEVRMDDEVRIRGWVYFIEEKSSSPPPALLPVSSAGGFIPDMAPQAPRSQGSRLEITGDAGEFLRKAWVHWETDPAFGSLVETETGFVRTDAGRWTTLNTLRVRSERELAGRSFPVQAILLGDLPTRPPPPTRQGTVTLAAGGNANLDPGEGGTPDVEVRVESGRAILSAAQGIASIGPAEKTLPTSGYATTAELAVGAGYAVRTDQNRYVRMIVTAGDSSTGRWTLEYVCRLDGSNLLP